MLIKGLQKHTFIDYPGRVACTIFVFGCNFRCDYCHNPELVDAGQGRELKIYSKEEILRFLEERKGFLSGICITGGEPTLNKELPEFIERIKGLGYRIKLDTNGTNPEMLELLLKKRLVDYIAMDFKAPFEKYEKIVNVKVNIADLKKSVALIKKFPDYEFRMTVVPTVTNLQDLLDIAKFLSAERANKAFYLQQFQPQKCFDRKFQKIKPYTQEQIEEFCKAIKPSFIKCEIRGRTY